MKSHKLLELALQQKWISPDDLAEIFRLQKRLVEEGSSPEEVSLEKLLLESKLLPPLSG